MSAAAAVFIAADVRPPTTDMMCFVFLCRVRRRRERGPRVRVMKVRDSSFARCLKTFNADEFSFVALSS